jgi:hypothetical protein
MLADALRDDGILPRHGRHRQGHQNLLLTYEVLASHGLEVTLANACEARAVPGRKSDVNDAQWLQRLPDEGRLSRPVLRGAAAQ